MDAASSARLRSASAVVCGLTRRATLIARLIAQNRDGPDIKNLLRGAVSVHSGAFSIAIGATSPTGVGTLFVVTVTVLPPYETSLEDAFR